MYLLYISNIVLLAFLGFAAWEDFKTHSVPLPLIAFSFAAGIIIQIILGELSLWEIFLGILPGAFLLLCAVLSKGKVGAGDGLSLIACGVCLGIYKSIFLLFCSLLFACVFAGAALITKKCGRKKELPFLPFVLAGYVALLAVF